MIKVDPIKSTASAKREAASSSSEALPAMVFLSSSDYNRFIYLITYLRQYMLRGKTNYPRTVTSTYDMLTSFELASPRRHHTKRMGYKGNRESCGGRGGRDHTFVQHTAPLGTVSITDLDVRTPYPNKCFNSEKWGN